MWDSIKLLGGDSSTPWMILGDFNSICSPEDKINGADVTAYELEDFNSCCMAVGLFNLKYVGAYYTWSNGKVFSKIDRALINKSWLDQFPDSFALNSAIGCISDHGQISVSLQTPIKLAAGGFKFSNEITLFPEFLPLVQHHWDTHSYFGTKAYIFCKLLKTIKFKLKLLHRSKCGNFVAQISELMRITSMLSLKSRSILCPLNLSLLWQSCANMLSPLELLSMPNFPNGPRLNSFLRLIEVLLTTILS